MIENHAMFRFSQGIGPPEAILMGLQPNRGPPRGPRDSGYITLFPHHQSMWEVVAEGIQFVARVLHSKRMARKQVGNGAKLPQALWAQYSES